MSNRRNENDRCNVDVHDEDDDGDGVYHQLMNWVTGWGQSVDCSFAIAFMHIGLVRSSTNRNSLLLSAHYKGDTHLGWNVTKPQSIFRGGWLDGLQLSLCNLICPKAVKCNTSISCITITAILLSYVNKGQEDNFLWLKIRRRLSILSLNDRRFIQWFDLFH